MDAFHTHHQVIDAYRSYLASFLNIQDERISGVVKNAIYDNGFLPEPLVQFNPEFAISKPLTDLVSEGKVHPLLPSVFGDYHLYKHQIDAIELGVEGKGFIVTSGTGSGKSLTFLATIFNELLQQGSEKPKGVKAILVYPMNALINSQEEEIKKYHINYLLAQLSGETYHGGNKPLDQQIEELEKMTGARFPVTYAKYTGQEGSEARKNIETVQPDIILTNYMMLELIMTRHSEEWMRRFIHSSLKYLVFDELHTYRGRQGSDVSLLIRRIKGLAKNELCCIGTSATMASVGTPIAKKKAVAEVAKTIFGQTFEIHQIIGETLKTCTNAERPSQEELLRAIQTEIVLDSEEVFRAHPLTNWLELTIALFQNEGHWERAKPRSISEMAAHLANETGGQLAEAHAAIVAVLKATEKLNEQSRASRSRNRFLPFRFHQFIAQTSIISVTLNKRELREITIQSGRYIKENGAERLLFPVLFSRVSGYDFLCVELDWAAHRILPRNPDEGVEMLKLQEAKKEQLHPGNFKDGYILLDEGEEFWQEDFLDYLPESWLNATGDALKPYYDWFMPKPIYFNEEGAFSMKSSVGLPLKGYYIPAKLKIDPSAGVVYEDSRVGEYTKLMKLGNEGRSTATTITSFAIIDALHQQGIDLRDQKLLSFTDNRQDASLQAGHFNDFLSTVRLRSAMYHALQAHPEGLDVYTIAERVFEVLNLSEIQYAQYPSDDPEFPEEQNARALKQYLLLRIFQDLKRGWRYTLPNLEQTALLRVEYAQLKKLASLDDRFLKIPPLYGMSPEKREQTLIQVLNFFRTNFALDHRLLLADRGETESLLRGRLNEEKLWSLDKRERIDSPKYLTIYNAGRTQKGIYTGSIGPQSGLGKFIKRLYKEQGMPSPDRDTLRTVLEELCETLVSPGLLKKEPRIKGDRTGEEGVAGYLLRTDCLRWFAGDGCTVGIDQTRVVAYREFNPQPNAYFQALYKRDFTAYKKEIEGREHTGQLSSGDRIEREDRFRKGEIAALFCSPTMELGIDIANLNIVHMRNVPPNPANYAQRSGRAGRSGQTALVYTYCSAFSPHDQNYFKAADTMVAGQVVPPRIDLLNEELIRTHFHAYLLMELGLNQLHTSVVTLVNIEKQPLLPLKDAVVHQIKAGIEKHGDQWMETFKRYLAEIMPELQATHWYGADWLNKVKSQFLNSFDNAFARWRNLYRSAKAMIEESHRINNDPTVKDKAMKQEAKRQYAVGLKQKDLLENEAASAFGNNSEFYVFRYLASEGFIPGYNFTRLPVRAFVGYKHMDDGEYISRPRFISLREFGPGNTIYHNGNKYRINRMMLTDADSLQRKMTISLETGYAFLDQEAVAANNDPITQAELTNKNSKPFNQLIEVGESEGTPQMRISCEEEERLSKGFQIENYFRYPSGIEHTVKSVIKSGGQALLQLIYGPATELIQLNRKWRKSPEEGYSIDKRNGRWLQAKELENAEIQANEKRVMIFARDTADTLYIQPLETLKLSSEQLISFSYALKRAIEVQFQVEESEIGVDIVGNPEAPNMLIYEASQGSLGILSVLASEPLQLRDLFTTAYRCMHFDPLTREETEIGKQLPKATYQDLLSYYNQRQHAILDRHGIKDALEMLMDCDVEKEQGGNDREAQMAMLLEQYDKQSSTELKFLRYLYDHCLALPDKAQVNVPEFYVSVDFVYNTLAGPVLVFCDGSVHDEPQVKESDEHKRELLRNHGYDVIEWNYSQPLAALVAERKDVFRKVC